ncbi:hypothetical protein [Cytobacillus massiliigabonensis]|uniref:hypothetical protein n=1 Tax=Cytobacillus massiliigabonensis TaxID=1871011 RepID=UPI000C84E2C9|nr:hypothetical protein [Cytobacillus massiliigabonensis]
MLKIAINQFSTLYGINKVEETNLTFKNDNISITSFLLMREYTDGDKSISVTYTVQRNGQKMFACLDTEDFIQQFIFGQGSVLKVWEREYINKPSYETFKQLQDIRNASVGHAVYTYGLLFDEEVKLGKSLTQIYKENRKAHDFLFNYLNKAE